MMKKIVIDCFVGLLFVLISFVPLYSAENTIETIPENYMYQELFTEGKSWIMWHGLESYPGYETHLIFKISVVGEQEVDGILCKKIKVEIDQSFRQGSCMQCMYFLGVDCDEGYVPPLPDYLYAYEKDKKIYVYRESGPYYEYDENGHVLDLKYGKPYFDLLMDLNVNVGDVAMGMGKITSVKYKEYGGVMRRVISNDVSYIHSDYYPTHWIEGIGSNYCADDWEWPFPPYISVPTSISNWYHNFLVSCSENGLLIYDNSEILREVGVNLDFISSVEKIQMTPSSGDSFYNLQGIPVENPHNGNIYIYRGKKIMF